MDNIWNQERRSSWRILWGERGKRTVQQFWQTLTRQRDITIQTITVGKAPQFELQRPHKYISDRNVFLFLPLIM
jgi:hypothetical protein